MDSIFVKFLKYLKEHSTENTSDTDFTALVDQTLNSVTFSVSRSETSTKYRSCSALPRKILVLTPYYFGRLHHFGVFFNKLNSEKLSKLVDCCLDFYGNENAKQGLENMFFQVGKTLNFCCSNFWEYNSILFSADAFYDKQNPQHNVYFSGAYNNPYFNFLTKGIVEYSNGTYDTMIKDFIENIDLLHTDSHRFIAFMYMWYRGVVMGINEDYSDLILMTTDYFNNNYNLFNTNY